MFESSNVIIHRSSSILLIFCESHFDRCPRSSGLEFLRYFSISIFCFLSFQLFVLVFIQLPKRRSRVLQLRKSAYWALTIASVDESNPGSARPFRYSLLTSQNSFALFLICVIQGRTSVVEFAYGRESLNFLEFSRARTSSWVSGSCLVCLQR